ncbi:hypothetical protein [Occallatibacter savannae]|uniref:hypothetical protein n=1 Tax=Occallatibacter savannae TaxID=1002691 RepID=UPI0013A54FAD|nr:hypothetical protein [Occallatibacter savannae]
MSDQKSNDLPELPEGRNPGRATVLPNPKFIIRHEQAIQRNQSEDVENTRQEEQPDSEGRFRETVEPK